MAMPAPPPGKFAPAQLGTILHTPGKVAALIAKMDGPHPAAVQLPPSIHGAGPPAMRPPAGRPPPSHPLEKARAAAQAAQAKVAANARTAAASANLMLRRQTYGLPAPPPPPPLVPAMPFNFVPPQL